MVGYDDANEPKLAAMIAKLIANPRRRRGNVVRVPLEYRAPGDGPKPNFSPKGTRVAAHTRPCRRDVLPAGAIRRAGIGNDPGRPDTKAGIPVLVTADAKHPQDLCNLFVDRNRNGSFADDGPAITATPSQNDKTKAWWSSFNKIELSVSYAATGKTEPYLVNFWIVREGDKTARYPPLLRRIVALRHRDHRRREGPRRRHGRRQ